MNVISRGVSSAFRNKIRSSSVIAVLALAIALALSMLVANQAVAQKIADLKSTVGTDLELSAAGSGGPGGFGGGSTLTNAMLEEVKKLPNVSAVGGTLRLELKNNNDTSESATRPGEEKSAGKTNLTSSIDSKKVESSGQKLNGQEVGTMVGEPGKAMAMFTPPISMTGVSADKDSSNKKIPLTSGSLLSNFNADSTEALVGKTLAEKNNLKEGSTFQAFGRTWTVKGIFDDSSSRFKNNGIYVPVSAAQAVSNQADTYNEIFATANSMDNVDSVKSAIQNKLGSDKVDVTSGNDQLDSATESLKSVQNISLMAFFATLAAAALFILLMMIIIVKELTKEIGVLKAIGASSSKISGQFMAEAVTLVSIAAVIGTLLSFLISTPLVNALVSRQNSSSGPGGRMGMGSPGGGGDFSSLARAAAGQITAAFTWQTLLIGIAGVLATALIGAGAASYFSSKIRPIEALRGE